MTKLTSAADGILVRPDGSHVIVDYKTAKFTGNQDGLFPPPPGKVSCLECGKLDGLLNLLTSP